MRTLKASDCVWRYMPFGRFVWMLSERKLWLARADTLGDPWEIALSEAQVAKIVAKHPVARVDDMSPREGGAARAERIINDWKKSTFISCWRASDDESHALWKIYCGSPEGVAIKTTFGKLCESVSNIEVRPVNYAVEPLSLSLLDLASTKRPVYAYEDEVRVISAHRAGARAIAKSEVTETAELVEWKAEDFVDAVFVHPNADAQFMSTVRAVVSKFTPALESVVQWSSMRATPAFFSSRGEPPLP